MVKEISATILGLILIGCSNPPVKVQPIVRTETVEVRVPVFECPAPPSFSLPSIPINTITDESTNAEIAEAYIKSIAIQKAYINQLENILQGYKKGGD